MPKHLLQRLTHIGLLLGGFSTLCNASDLALEATLGGTNPSANDYSGDRHYSLALAYNRDAWVYRLGYANFGELDLRNSPNDTYIAIDGGFFQAGRRFEREHLTLEAGAGILVSSSEAIFGNNRLGTERDTSAYLDLRASLAWHRHIQVHGGYRLYFDVSGSDLHTPYIGISYTF